VPLGRNEGGKREKRPNSRLGGGVGKKAAVFYLGKKKEFLFLRSDLQLFLIFST